MKFYKMLKFNIGCWIVASMIILFVWAFLSGLWAFITSLAIPTIVTYLIAATIIILSMTLVEYLITEKYN